MIFPDVTGFHWGEFDFQWYVEACVSHPARETGNKQFHDVNRFITLPPLATSGNQSIPDYVKAVKVGIPAKGTTPVELARRIHQHADRALTALDALKTPGLNRELRQTLEDIRAMALLGKYYGHKIQGATELALFRDTHEASRREAAIGELTKASGYWQRYTGLMKKNYKNPLWLNRVGIIDWDKLAKAVEEDIEIARREQLPDNKPPGN